MALRPLSVIEKTKLASYADFVGTVEQAAREKARVFLSGDLETALPGWAASRKEMVKLKIFSQQIRDGQYVALDLAKKFLAKHTGNFDDTNATLDQITANMLALGQFDTFIDAVFRDQILSIEMA